MNTRICLFFIILVIGPSSFARTPASETGEEAVILQVARRGLPGFLKDIPEQDRPLFGIFKPEDIRKAGPGSPFRVYTIDPGDLASLSGRQAFGNVLKETGDWYVPVIVGREFRLLMTISRMKGTWQAVGVSEAELAAEIGEFRARWPGLAAAAAIPRDSGAKFFRVFQASADFMYVRGPKKEFLWPFSSALRISGLENKGKHLLPAELVIPLLRHELDRPLAKPVLP